MDIVAYTEKHGIRLKMAIRPTRHGLAQAWARHGPSRIGPAWHGRFFVLFRAGSRAIPQAQARLTSSGAGPCRLEGTGGPSCLI